MNGRNETKKSLKSEKICDTVVFCEILHKFLAPFCEGARDHKEVRRHEQI